MSTSLNGTLESPFPLFPAGVGEALDLTHPIEAGMPVFPGDPEPRFEPLATVKTEGYRLTALGLATHTGTHIDAAAHVFADGQTLDLYPASQFAGSALVIDCKDLGPGGAIPLSRIQRAGEAAKKADFILFRTGWGQRWGKSGYFGDYPVPSEEVASWICCNEKKGIGLDTPGPDPVDAHDLLQHKRILCREKTVILENLAGLEQLPEGRLFWLSAMPLLVKRADGAPARVIAFL